MLFGTNKQVKLAVAQNFTNCLALIFFMTLSACLSFYFGKDLDFDLGNYHYYDPYAFLHHRFGFDYWPGSYFHVYLVPTADFLTYFFIQKFPPQITTMLSGAVQGVAFWLLFLIARFFLANTKYVNIKAILFALLGMYAPLVITSIGKFHNDLITAIFVLSFILLQLHVLKACQEKNQLRGWLNFSAGVMLGIAIGLKLTACIYLCGGFISLLLVPLRWMDRLKLMMTLLLGVGVGDVVTAGYWMWILWVKFHNPFFPLFNGIFHSPDFASQNWRYTEYLPQDAWHAIFFPFYSALKGTLVDNYFRDVRYPIIYVLLVMAGVVGLVRKKENKINYPLVWLSCFYVLSFAVNEYYFAILRYVIVLEMLAVLFIWLLIKSIFTRDYVRNSVFAVCIYIILMVMVPVYSVRAPWYHSNYFDQKMPTRIQQVKHATVLMAYPAYTLTYNPRPQAFLIPFFPAQWRFVGVPFVYDRYDAADKIMQKNIAALTQSKNENYYLLTTEKDMLALMAVARQFSLVPTGSCEFIPNERSTISHERSELCSARHV